MKSYVFIVLVFFTEQVLFGQDLDKIQRLRDYNMLSRGEDVYADTNLANFNPKDLIKTKIGFGIDLVLLKRTRDWRECLPAKDFPGGNWGPLTNDTQVSLRFEKPLYTNGEAFHAIVLVRNCGTNELLYFDPIHFNHNQIYASVNYCVFDQSNQPVVPKELKDIPNQSPSVGAGGIEILEPNAQRKSFNDLNNIYDLTNGNYFVQASVTAQRDLNKADSFYLITSARVPLEIQSP